MFGLPNLASMYLNPGRSACPPFLNKVYETLVTKDQLLNNISYYHARLSLLPNLSHHWHELTVNLDIFKERSLWSAWPWTKSSNSVYNNNTLQLLHSVSADQQQNSIASPPGLRQTTGHYNFST